jgi:hypothetical protein
MERELARREKGTYRAYVTDEQRGQRAKGPPIFGRDY